MMVLAIVILVLFLLAIMQVGAKLTYDGEEFAFKIRVGFFRFGLSGNPDKEQKKKNEKPPKEKAIGPKQKNSAKSARIKSWVKAVLLHFGDILALVGKVLRSPTLDVLKLHMIVGASDPEVCAMNYGKFHAMIGSALPVVENVFGIRKRDVRVDCDFMQDDNQMDVRVEITVRIYEVLAIAVAGIKLLIHLYRTQKSIYKAVRINESSSS